MEYDHILKEIHTVLIKISDDEQELLVSSLMKAKRVYLAGAGRSGLIIQCFAMRLMHLGMQAYHVGGVTTPPIGQGDLLLIASGSGETASLVSMAQKAHALEAKIALVTVSTQSSISRISDCTVRLDAPTKVDKQRNDASIQPMASLFEQSMMIFFDCIVLHIMKQLGLTAEEMAGRHANLE